MSKQVVARTHATRRGYYHNEDDYCRLKKLLEEGYKVIMCNTLTKENGETELEYILEKEREANGI